jgi:uncharacterized phage protein gp47/JayE
VVVLVVADGPDGVSLPPEAKRREVEAFLEERRPVTAQVLVATPRTVPVPLSLRLRPDMEESRAAVRTALLGTFARLAPGEEVSVSRLAAAAVLAPGIADAALLLPSANVALGESELAVLGGITWAA